MSSTVSESRHYHQETHQKNKFYSAQHYPKGNKKRRGKTRNHQNITPSVVSCIKNLQSSGKDMASRQNVVIYDITTKKGEVIYGRLHGNGLDSPKKPRKLQLTHWGNANNLNDESQIVSIKFKDIKSIRKSKIHKIVCDHLNQKGKQKQRYLATLSTKENTLVGLLDAQKDNREEGQYQPIIVSIQPDPRNNSVISTTIGNITSSERLNIGVQKRTFKILSKTLLIPTSLVEIVHGYYAPKIPPIWIKHFSEQKNKPNNSTALQLA